MQKISITLDKDVLAFVDSQTNNRSQYINSVLKKQQKQKQLETLKQAYIEQARDPEEIAEITLWDR